MRLPAGTDLNQYIMIGVALLIGFVCILPYIVRHTANKSAVPVVVLIALILYLIIAAVLLFVLSTLSNANMMAFSVLQLLGLLAAALLLYTLFRNRRHINKWGLALFLVYVLAVGYITIFSRGDGTNDTSILMVPFESVAKAVRKHNSAALQHMLLNVVMFVPLGFLFSMIDPPRLGRLSWVLAAGLCFTVTIESIQLMSKMGQCDIDDIIANILGTLIGFALYKLFTRLRPAPEHEEDAGAEAGWIPQRRSGGDRT